MGGAACHCCTPIRSESWLSKCTVEIPIWVYRGWQTTACGSSPVTCFYRQHFIRIDQCPLTGILSVPGSCTPSAELSSNDRDWNIYCLVFFKEKVHRPQMEMVICFISSKCLTWYGISEITIAKKFLGSLAVLKCPQLLPKDLTPSTLGASLIEQNSVDKEQAETSEGNIDSLLGTGAAQWFPSFMKNWTWIPFWRDLMSGQKGSKTLSKMQVSFGKSRNGTEVSWMPDGIGCDRALYD